MLHLDPCLITFVDDISSILLPEHFTFPFYYVPHPLAVLAARKLQDKLVRDELCNRALGVNDESTESGKMFGVLVVQDDQNQLGFLAAYSGQFEQHQHTIPFVPAVSDMQINDDEYIAERDIINELNQQVQAIELDDDFTVLTKTLVDVKATYLAKLTAQQGLMVEARKERKTQRSSACDVLSVDEFTLLEKKLAGESIQQKKQLQALKLHWQSKIQDIEEQINAFDTTINKLKKQRKQRSKSLQKCLFSQYKFLNANNNTRDLNEIFSVLPERTPPAGSGDCAAPKLLQYAYKNQLKPVVMAEFWWGGAPKSAVRQHKNYYPSCYSKCQPILGHMLEGLNVEPNPLLINPAANKDLTIVYQDNDLVVVNKPEEFLSVPGKNIEDSVYLRIKNQFPNASGPLIVHRLDMSTSGLLVIALNKRAHKALQKQFIERVVEKRYVALIDGVIKQKEGTIELPLRLDLDDKPRQLVCEKYGKPATTYWQVIRYEGNKTLMYLYPKTGRTHQLRVHCAHALGLNAPIVGDDHYGEKANRLHLHAEYLAFQHPINKTQLEFQVPAGFA